MGIAARLTLKMSNQVVLFTIQSIGHDVVVVSLVENGVYPVRLFRAPIQCSSGGDGTREAVGTVTENLIGRRSTRKCTAVNSIGSVSITFGEGRGQLDHRRA